MNIYDPEEVLSVVRASENLIPFQKGEHHEVKLPSEAFIIEASSDIQGYPVAVLNEDIAAKFSTDLHFPSTLFYEPNGTLGFDLLFSIVSKQSSGILIVFSILSFAAMKYFLFFSTPK